LLVPQKREGKKEGDGNDPGVGEKKGTLLTEKEEEARCLHPSPYVRGDE